MACSFTLLYVRLPPRNITLDYLRVLCTALIVCIHSSGLDVSRALGSACSTQTLTWAFVKLLLGMAVPPFFMMSGAFMLNKDIQDVFQFYKKSYGRLLPWSIFFFFVASVFQILNHAYNSGTNIWDTDFIAHYIRWFTYGGSGVLWFIFALMGLYLITPVLIFIRKRTSLVSFCIITLITLLATRHILCNALQADYASYPINWFKGMFFIGHYMLGYCIYEICKRHKNRILNAYTTAGALLLFLLVNTFIASTQLTQGFDFSINAQSAVNIFSSALMFALFNLTRLPDTRLVSYIASISLIIYLSHNYLSLPIFRFFLNWTGIWDTLFRTSILFNLVNYIIAFAISVIFAHFLNKAALLVKRKRPAAF